MVAKWGFCLGLQFTLGCTCQVSLIKSIKYIYFVEFLFDVPN